MSRVQSLVSFVAQAWQMQALRCEAAGTWVSSSGEKDTFTHQHVVTVCPVAFATSIAH